MKAETPAQGILKINDWGQSKMYKVQCDCGSNDCAHIIDVEADEHDITVTIYTTSKTPYWRMSRWNQIWQLLTKGYLEYESTTIMKKQVALNYASVLQSAVKDVEEFRNKDGKNQNK